MQSSKFISECSDEILAIALFESEARARNVPLPWTELPPDIRQQWRQKAWEMLWERQRLSREALAKDVLAHGT